MDQWINNKCIDEKEFKIDLSLNLYYIIALIKNNLKQEVKVQNIKVKNEWKRY